MSKRNLQKLTFPKQLTIFPPSDTFCTVVIPLTEALLLEVQWFREALKLAKKTKIYTVIKFPLNEQEP